ncbi:MobQ family relaxase [Planococcus lenghuensis]|uniref:MobA/MobL protein domain-containing protein n=1 Tax=Planococcus lenghuensis TaxID=2213202 RepID=A0A1Q2L465_9BACL|nr:MobQ family relaxase [Planococcus lenghuensis]AQQ55240.1 hypothetical protein B0X71_18835 [Planococcus lenghuensis]
MSYFRLQANIISKKNQSAVASASYRSGEDLYSERDEELKSFKEREVAPVSFILKPDHAPEWALDRERLWNEVERIEKAWNAQLAREVLVALPVDLDEKQQNELVRSFVQDQFVDAGMVADVAIHRDKEHNPHAHILLTVRPFEADGTWGNKKTRQYEYEPNGDIKRDDEGRKIFQTVSATDWNERETLVKWRMQYAEAINTAFKEAGVDKTVSALSFEERGLDKIAQVRLGRNEYQYVKRMEEKGLEAKTFYHELNQEIRKANEQIAQLNHNISFLSSTEKMQNLQLLLHRHTKEITMQLDADYQKSLRFMRGRLKEELSFKNVKNELEGLYRWEERSLEPKQVKGQVTHAILDASHQAYLAGDKTALTNQGFSSDRFHDRFTARLDAFEAQEEALKKNSQTNETVTAHTERTYRVYSLITHNTFNDLYPDLDERHQFNDRTTAYKAAVIEAALSGDWHRVPATEDVETELHLSELEKACTLAEKATESIRIQARVRDKLGAEKAKLVREGQKLDAIYQTSLKLNTAQQLIGRYEEKAQLHDRQLGELIRATFPQANERVLQKLETLPLEMKTDLLNHYRESKLAGDEPSLPDCLQAARKSQEQREAQHEQYRQSQDHPFYRGLPAREQEKGHLPGGTAGIDLMDELVRQSAQPNPRTKETGRMDKLNRKGKNTRMRRYLGLEIEL